MVFEFDGSPAYVISLAYLVIFGSIIAFGAYLTLLGRIGAHKAGYAVVMFPVVALVLSVLFEGLQMSANIGVGIVLVIAGNLFILQRNATPVGKRASASIRPVGAVCAKRGLAS